MQLVKLTKPLKLGGKDYLYFEHWITIARFFNATVGIDWTKQTATGWEAQYTFEQTMKDLLSVQRAGEQHWQRLYDGENIYYHILFFTPGFEKDSTQSYQEILGDKFSIDDFFKLVKFVQNVRPEAAKVIQETLKVRHQETGKRPRWTPPTPCA